MDNNPMRPWENGLDAASKATRCLALTRKGTPCQAPAMKNGRCRMHGGKSTGPPLGSQNALIHGFYTAKAKAERKAIKALLRYSGQLLERLR